MSEIQTAFIVFCPPSGGGGELSPAIRAAALEGLGVLGIEIDAQRNELSRTRNGETCIADPASPVTVFVIRTDDERVMVEDSVALVEGRHARTRLRYSFEDPAFVDQERYAALQAEIAKTPALAEIVVSGQRS